MLRPTEADVLALRDTMVDEAPPTTDIYAIATGYVAENRDHKNRIEVLDNLVAGRWATIWPDDTVTADMPKIADFISSDLEDLSSLIAAAQPTVVVDPDSDQPKAIRDAERRAHALATYRRASRLEMTRRELAMDLAGTGLASMVIWPDYWSSDPTQRYPTYIRKDPRHIYPDPAMSNPDEVTSCVVSYRTKARVLAKQFPHIRGELFATHEQAYFDTADINVVEYYDSDWCIKLAAWHPSSGRARTTLIAAIRNLVGCPLIVLAKRPTFDGKFRGQFDKAIGPLGTANRMMELHLAQLSDMIYAEKIIKGVFDNPQDVGPGASLYTTDYQADIYRAKPAGSHNQLYQDIQILLEQARSAAGVPAARHGDIDQNIASAQFVTAIQGKYITAVSNYQLLLADLEMRANTLAFKVDEAYLDYPNKVLASVPGGRTFKNTYTPSRDIGGRHENRVVYGAGSGMDSYNRKLSVIQDVNAGLVSRRTARGQLEYVLDVLAEESEMAREALEQAFLQLVADPNRADLGTITQVLAETTSGKTLGEVAQQMYDAAQEAAAAQQAAAGAELVPGVAPAPAALGAAGQGPPTQAPPEEQGLPPLGALRGGGG
jgi:hypothetical protein